jgi:hypothetical protein
MNPPLELVDLVRHHPVPGGHLIPGRPKIIREILVDEFAVLSLAVR